MGSFEQRLDQRRKRSLKDQSRVFGALGLKSIVPTEWAERNLSARKYDQMETDSWSPELNDYDPDSTSYLNSLWDQLSPDEKRSRIEEPEFKEEVLKRLKKIK